MLVVWAFSETQVNLQQLSTLVAWQATANSFDPMKLPRLGVQGHTHSKAVQGAEKHGAESHVAASGANPREVYHGSSMYNLMHTLLHAWPSSKLGNESYSWKVQDPQVHLAKNWAKATGTVR